QAHGARLFGRLRAPGDHPAGRVRHGRALTPVDLGLGGKRALVTGASKGIGLAIAQAVAAEGCRVDIASRNLASLETAAEVIRNVIGYAGERHNAKYVIGSTGNAALMAFTRTAGSQSPDFGVRILGVNPGYTATDRAEGQLRTFAQKKFGDAERWRDIEKEFNLPFGRMAKPQEIADTVAFLVSPRAGYISGTI